MGTVGRRKVLIKKLFKKWILEIDRGTLTLELKFISINIDVIQLQTNGIRSNFLPILENLNITEIAWFCACETILSIAMPVFGRGHIDTKIWK